MNNKIICAVIDDVPKQVKNLIEDSFTGPDKINKKIKELGSYFYFHYIDSAEELTRERLSEEINEKKIDFFILDARSRDDRLEYTMGLINKLDKLKMKYCIFTSDPSWLGHLDHQFDCNVFKKIERQDSSKICQGGIFEMLSYIKSDFSFDKYLDFLDIVDVEELNTVLRHQLYGDLNTYLNNPTNRLNELNATVLEKFVEHVCRILIKLEIIPNTKSFKDEEVVKLTNCINFLVRQTEWLYFILKEKNPYNSSFLKIFNVVEGSSAKRKVEFTDLFKKIGLTHSDSKQLQNTLIGQSLNFIYTFRNDHIHNLEKITHKSAQRIVYDSIFFVCNRLNMIFDYLKKENHKLLKLFGKNNIDDITNKLSSNEEVKEKVTDNEEIPFISENDMSSIDSVEESGSKI